MAMFLGSGRAGIRIQGCLICLLSNTSGDSTETLRITQVTQAFTAPDIVLGALYTLHASLPRPER